MKGVGASETMTVAVCVDVVVLTTVDRLENLGATEEPEATEADGLM